MRSIIGSPAMEVRARHDDFGHQLADGRARFAVAWAEWASAMKWRPQTE
jgi:hypothetical protein